VPKWFGAQRYGYRYHQLLAADVHGGARCAGRIVGAVLPLWIRTLAAESAALGDRVGRLLTWNTLGAVVAC